MAEVPQHLLDKAKARRAALAGTPIEETALATAAPSLAAAVVADAPTAASAGGGSGGGGSKSPAMNSSTAAPPPPPRGTGFAKMGSVFLLVALPLWAAFMFNSFATPVTTTLTPEIQGAKLFEANCVVCHLANGAGWDAGGTGRALYNGEVEKTFPLPLDQVAYVKHGSCTKGSPYGNPKREGGVHVAQQKGVMPAFAGVLTDTEILYVIQYERSILRAKDAGWPVDLFAAVGQPADPKNAPVPGQPPTTLPEVKTDKVCPE